MTAAPAVRITMPARPEGVGVVRQALAGLADALDVDPAILADMKMAVTEACTNVVVHAYEQEGLLEVDMTADGDGVTVLVRDHGNGIRPHPADADTTALGLGLPLIAALSDTFELRGGSAAGTEVSMTFAYSRDGDPAERNPISGGPGAAGGWSPAPRDSGHDR